jgi:UDP-4-amino-4,6-dideoxy-N-acetyl-beta-L-altrosamine N-acetyltransferase
MPFTLKQLFRKGMPTSDIHKDFQYGKLKMTNFINLSMEDADRVLEWRNSDVVRKNVAANPRIISMPEHIEFINKLRSCNDRSYFMVSSAEILLGVVCLLNIDHFSRRCLWGDYTNPGLTSKGAGAILEYAALFIAFDVFNLHCVRCETLEHNKSALRLHDFFGFTREGTLKDYFYNEQTDSFNNVVLMSISEQSWLENRRNVDQLVNSVL